MVKWAKNEVDVTEYPNRWIVFIGFTKNKVSVIGFWWRDDVCVERCDGERLYQYIALPENRTDQNTVMTTPRMFRTDTGIELTGQEVSEQIVDMMNAASESVKSWFPEPQGKFPPFMTERGKTTILSYRLP